MAQTGGSTFVVTGTITPGAIATQIWEIIGVANKSLEIVRLDMTFAVTASNFVTLEIATATGAASTWSTSTPAPFSVSGSGASSSFAPKLWSSATSANGAGYAARLGWNINVVAGFSYFPVPEERIELLPGTGNFLVVKLTGATAASVPIYTNLVYRELW